jgi:hypothetical protein
MTVFLKNQRLTFYQKRTFWIEKNIELSLHH